MQVVLIKRRVYFSLSVESGLEGGAYGYGRIYQMGVGCT